MDIDLTLAGAEGRLTATARNSLDQQAGPRLLDLKIEAVTRFAADLRDAAAHRRPLSSDLLERAQALWRAVLCQEIDALRTRLAGAAGGPLLIRLGLPDKTLQSIPWEALCKPGKATDFWATSSDLLPVRRVISDEPWQPRVVDGALNVLAIAPSGGPSLAVLRNALAERIDAGEVRWLDPVEGPAARVSSLFDRLRCKPVPHVIHFVGHGGVRVSKGQREEIPILWLADHHDDDDDESWVSAELLATQLKANFRGLLRLVVLEACEGALPTVFASAAQCLAGAGVHAVVAHLWPVKADVARTCSAHLYSAIAGPRLEKGDIAFGVNEARRAILAAFQQSAEAFSPVVYLRGPDSVLFNFKGRKPEPPQPMGGIRPPSGKDRRIQRLLGKPFSLLLGDRVSKLHANFNDFNDKLYQELVKNGLPASPKLPVSVLAQRYALHRGVQRLENQFRMQFGSAEAPPFIASLARHMGPGVHTTLLRHPLLEDALVEQNPDRTLYVIQPSADGLMTLRREPGECWEDIQDPPAAFDPDEDIMLLRLYGGYMPEHLYARPLLTEDDYVLGLYELDNALPRDLNSAILSTLSYRPALLVGCSMYIGQHRILLHRLYPRGIPRGSIAVLEPQDTDRVLWEKGSGLPGRGEGVEVVESFIEDLAAVLDTTESVR